MGKRRKRIFDEETQTWTWKSLHDASQKNGPVIRYVKDENGNWVEKPARKGGAPCS